MDSNTEFLSNCLLKYRSSQTSLDAKPKTLEEFLEALEKTSVEWKGNPGGKEELLKIGFDVQFLLSECKLFIKHLISKGYGKLDLDNVTKKSQEQFEKSLKTATSGLSIAGLVRNIYGCLRFFLNVEVSKILKVISMVIKGQKIPDDMLPMPVKIDRSVAIPSFIVKFINEYQKKVPKNKLVQQLQVALAFGCNQMKEFCDKDPDNTNPFQKQFCTNKEQFCSLNLNNQKTNESIKCSMRLFAASTNFRYFVNKIEDQKLRGLLRESLIWIRSKMEIDIVKQTTNKAQLKKESDIQVVAYIFASLIETLKEKK